MADSSSDDDSEDYEFKFSPIGTPRDGSDSSDSSDTSVTSDEGGIKVYFADGSFMWLSHKSVFKFSKLKDEIVKYGEKSKYEGIHEPTRYPKKLVAEIMYSIQYGFPTRALVKKFSPDEVFAFLDFFQYEWTDAGVISSLYDELEGETRYYRVKNFLNYITIYDPIEKCPYDRFSTKRYQVQDNSRNLIHYKEKQKIGCICHTIIPQ